MMCASASNPSVNLNFFPKCCPETPGCSTAALRRKIAVTRLWPFKKQDNTSYPISEKATTSLNRPRLRLSLTDYLFSCNAAFYTPVLFYCATFLSHRFRALNFLFTADPRVNVPRQYSSCRAEPCADRDRTDIPESRRPSYGTLPT